jgi:hypothetical protein
VSEDLTCDPLIQKLSRFTPSSSSVDRDAMLFAAARASASKARGWKLLATALAMSQTAMLAVWLAGPGADLRGARSGPLNIDKSMVFVVSAPVLPPVSPESYGSLMRHLERDGLPMPEPLADPMPAERVLSADLRSQETSFE